ncbi:MAG: hypothetical protein KAS94_05360 [Desulfobulbaceae bacterium]|nr:hypothetical protein [Desulfobulbaceae bacterium]
MNLDATHILLVKGPDQASCRARVLNFFAKNFLVKYDSVKVVDDRSFAADSNLFWEIVEAGIKDNQQVLAKLVRELQESGFEKLTDLPRIPQGYESKTLHIITHLLDGFFGVDSCFYNLEEDSHWLSEQLGATIRAQPRDFRVLTVKCSSEAGTSTDLLAKIRKFESGF